jgi:Tol biopolymer transport system component
MRTRSKPVRTAAWLTVVLLAALAIGMVDLSAQPALLALVASRRAASLASSANAQEEVSFVSYAPGSIPEADSIEVQNLTRDLLVGAPMVNGGVDPIAIPASVGDNLEITVFRQMIIFERTTRPVPDSKPPVVVRTKPPRGRTRVPLNASAVMVFTEPISGGTVTPETIRLLKGGQPLPATFAQSADGLTIELTPDQPLEHATTYTISITTGVRDLAGDALEAEFTSDFTTVAAQLIGEIVFESNRSGNNEIWTMKSDGTDLFQITDRVAGGLATGPAVSPDGRRIAFSLADPASGDDWDIYLINVDGSGVTNLTNDPAFDGWRPAWSPDGTKVAFFSDRTGDEEIWVINADGTGAVNLTNSPGSDADPAWSPDGTKIAFLSFRDGNGEIYVMNADGTGQTRLTDEPAREDWPAWSPDGTRIAFDSFRDGSRQIYIMNADGTNVVRLTSTPEGTSASAAAWSPDGAKIALSSDLDSGLDIWLINIDGTGLVNLTDGVCCDFFPSWSP